MISDARHRPRLILIYIVFLTVCIQLQSLNAAPRPSTVAHELLMAPPKRGARAVGTGDGNRRSPSRITRKIRELRQKLLSAMRSDKVGTGLCEVTVLLRSDCEQKCHFSGASARCYGVRSVTLLIRSTADTTRCGIRALRTVGNIGKPRDTDHAARHSVTMCATHPRAGAARGATASGR
jgi:hypothetical protein